ncbi:nucleotide exchange factor GrpE [Halorientalis litorea]|uniref:nucleotide exchange factor GrpE n=1 Tax=Halorientalis litorea TaxID=2931977 RepID=UPI001FF4D7C1|nr:nucleotide exchange factor GrpE [Halorientalis litorea]
MSEQDASEPDGTETADEDVERTPESSAGADDSLADIAEGGEDGEIDDDLVERVADADPEQMAREVASLRMRVDSLESQLETREEEVEELESQLARTKADFQNYKKRMDKRREEEKQRATEDLVTRLLDVRDNLVRALEQDEGADIRDGIETTLRQFDEELDHENVETVDPQPGDEVDPQRHEVLLRVESDQPDGTVAEVHRPGYEMAGKVIRTAQVTVSEGGAGDADGS